MGIFLLFCTVVLDMLAILTAWGFFYNIFKHIGFYSLMSQAPYIGYSLPIFAIVSIFFYLIFCLSGLFWPVFRRARLGARPPTTQDKQMMEVARRALTTLKMPKKWMVRELPFASTASVQWVGDTLVIDKGLLASPHAKPLIASAAAVCTQPLTYRLMSLFIPHEQTSDLMRTIRLPVPSLFGGCGCLGLAYLVGSVCGLMFEPVLIPVICAFLLMVVGRLLLTPAWRSYQRYLLMAGDRLAAQRFGQRQQLITALTALENTEPPIHFPQLSPRISAARRIDALQALV